MSGASGTAGSAGTVGKAGSAGNAGPAGTASKAGPARTTAPTGVTAPAEPARSACPTEQQWPAGAGHVVVVDLGHGDAGKGSTVDWLCSPAAGGVRRDERTGSTGHAGGAGRAGMAGPASLAGLAGHGFGAVIRFNGGAQAAHNVVAPDGRHHTFAQFGAGTLHGVPTHLSRFMLVEPFALAAEAAHLAAIGVPDPFGLLTVDRRALLTTPYHRAANRLREAARSPEPGGGRHGSCGLGIGETVAYSLAVAHDAAPRVGDCQTPAVLAAKLGRLRDHLAADLAVSGLELPDDLPAPEFCAEVYAAFAGRARIVGEEYLPRLLAAGPCVFEGAQGVLLDEWYGFHPHTTWSTTTFANARTLLAEAGLPADGAFRLGVVRTYTTRHGAGPLVTEDRRLAASLPEPHNGTGEWQGAFRTGPFDVVAHRYALEVCGDVDGLVVGHATWYGRLPGVPGLPDAGSGGAPQTLAVSPVPTWGTRRCSPRRWRWPSRCSERAGTRRRSGRSSWPPRSGRRWRWCPRGRSGRGRRP